MDHSEVLQAGPLHRRELQPVSCVGGARVLGVQRRAALEQEVEVRSIQVLAAALQPHLHHAQSDNKLVLVEEGPRSASKGHTEQVLHEHTETGGRVDNPVEVGVAIQDRVEDGEEEGDRVLVQEVERVQAVQHKEHAAARGGQRDVEGGHALHLLHDLLGLRHLLFHLTALPLEALEHANDVVVLEDVSLGLGERREQLRLQLAEANAVLALQLEKIRPLLVHVRPFSLEDQRQALALQPSRRDSEVDQGDPRAEVGCEVVVRVPGRQEQGESGREVDVVLAEADESAATGLVDLLVEHWVEDRVNTFDVGDKEWRAKPHAGLQLLEEPGVEEGSLHHLGPRVLLHQVVDGLSARVDNERIAVVPREHNGVLDAEVVLGKSVAVPSKAAIACAQEFHQRQVGLAHHLGRVQTIHPLVEQDSARLLLEHATVGEEGRSEQHVTDHRAHGLTERRLLCLPAGALLRERAKERG
mmetsp:Transcript_10836/g.24584  ORF Transcript_10836/g.24584 Transcript_10836/m.24584 type:complete len:471 (-) Transcript_10836:1029-2441(-)